MNKTNLLMLIIVILSATTLTVYALAEDVNISKNETTAADAITINETANIINVTKNSNETNLADMLITEEQKKSSPGFSLTDTVIALITSIILITVYKIGRFKNEK